MNARFATLFTAALFLAPEPAAACGGFFCSQAQPIDQSGEAVVFSVGANRVTMHVQIEYEGPSEEFAWVVPVGGEPELFLSKKELFDALPGATQPTFVMNRDTSQCAEPKGAFDTDIPMDSADTDTDSDADADVDLDVDGVDVVGEELVGAYETVTLTATSSEALVEWLDVNGYDLPAAMDGLLAPYVANGMYFVALKLQKSSSDWSGNLEPLALRYPGTKPVIPIQLTAVAAIPDMRLNVYVFGDSRAVPTNYLHVRANPLLVDWDNWQFDDSYNAAITTAADDAGGQAFATDYAGRAPNLLPTNDYDVEVLRELTDPWEFVSMLGTAGFSNTAEVRRILRPHLPIPEDFGPTLADVLDCPHCYSLPDGPFDPEAAAQDLEDGIVTPERNVAELWTKQYLTRLRSSVSPEEMTVDPAFHLVKGLPDVAQTRSAEMIYLCSHEQDPAVRKGHRRFVDSAPRRTTYPGGYEIVLPSMNWMRSKGLSDRDYLEDLFSRSALVVEEIDASSKRLIVEDHRDELRRILEEASWVTDPRKCGCMTLSPRASFFLAPLLLLAIRRRNS